MLTNTIPHEFILGDLKLSKFKPNYILHISGEVGDFLEGGRDFYKYWGCKKGILGRLYVLGGSSTKLV